MENEIIRKTNANSSVQQALEKPTRKFGEIWNRTYEANSIHMWNEFTSQYPEKGKTYKELLQSIPKTSLKEELVEYGEKANEASLPSRVDRFSGVQEQLPLTPDQLRELRLEQVLGFNKLEIPERIEYYAAMVEKAESKAFDTREMDQVLQNIAIDSRSDQLNLIYLSRMLKKIDREEHNAIMENVELLPEVQNILSEVKKVNKRLDGMVPEEDIQDDSNVDVKRYFTLKHLIRDCIQNIKNVFFFKEVLSRLRVEDPKKEKLYMDVINNRVIAAVQNSADIWRRILADEKELIQNGIRISADPEVGLKEWREKMENQVPKDHHYKPESLDAINTFILSVRNTMTREELAVFENSMRGRESDTSAYIDGIVTHVLKNIPAFKDILVDVVSYFEEHPQGKTYLYDPIRKGPIMLKNGKLCVQKDTGGIEFLTK